MSEPTADEKKGFYEGLVSQLKTDLQADAVVLIVKGGVAGNAMIAHHRSAADARALYDALSVLMASLKQAAETGASSARMVSIPREREAKGKA